VARTTPSAVQAILLDNYDSVACPDLTPFVDASNAVVSQVSTCAISRSQTLSTSVLELIERWLAAHFYVAADPLYSKSKTADATGEFQGRNFGRVENVALDSTDYGRRAKMLDHTGCLASLGVSSLPQAVWLGKAPSDQIDYTDRN
jgi:hypothetical protein